MEWLLRLASDPRVDLRRLPTLIALASLLNYGSGEGYASVEQIIERRARYSPSPQRRRADSTVREELKFVRELGYLRRTRVGRRDGSGTGWASEWVLTAPAISTADANTAPSAVESLASTADENAQPSAAEGPISTADNHAQPSAVEKSQPPILAISTADDRAQRRRPPIYPPVPPTVGAHPRADEAASGDAQTLVAEWLDHCKHRPPGKVIARVGRELKAMLGEGIAYTHLRAGLAEWHRKGLDASVLPSVVNEVMNASRNGHRPAAAPSNAPARIPRGEECPKHRGRRAGKCGLCRADQIGVVRDE